jgi:uncharacterized protein
VAVPINVPMMRRRSCSMATDVRLSASRMVLKTLDRSAPVVGRRDCLESHSMERISAAQARRIALAAQGFDRPRPKGRVDRRHGRRLFDDMGLIQVDSVNVLVRSQELPVFARLGNHDRDLLPSMIRNDELFEFWGHEASLIPVDRQPLFRWRMERGRTESWGGLQRLNKERAGYVNDVLAEIAARGPLTVSELSNPGGKKSSSWWGWSDGKLAVEYLFWTGAITARRRPHNFEREYGLPEEFIPADVLARPTPSESDARKELLVLAAAHHGVGTARDLADYYRQKMPVARPLFNELVEDGRLLPVQVDGWKDPAYLHPDARMPRRINAHALLSPFDPVVWERSRTERLFGFHYRIEIYVPAPKRIHGYYVLPFLMGDNLAARVDLKADRHAGELLVQGSFAEPGHDPNAVAEALGAELTQMAAWLGLERVVVKRNGDLARPLSAVVR